MTTIPYGGAIAQIGDLTVVPVFDGYSSEDPTHFYVTRSDAAPERGHRREDWDAYPELLDRDGRIEHGLGGFVVLSGERVVLVDSGVGPQQIGPYGPYARVIAGGELPTRMREAGVEPDTVTDVVLTHLHPDHYGWAVHDGGSTFPNATIRCHAADWDHFVVRPQGATSAFSARLQAVANRVETWERDGPLFTGIDTMLAPGHTPGSTIIVLSSGDERALLLGDVVHCPVELLDVEWAGLGDVDPALARRTRVALAREIEEKRVPAVGAHFPGMRFGRLLAAQGRRQWVA